MALSKADKEWIVMTFENAHARSIEPLRDIIQRHEQSLYGAKGANGLTGDMKIMKERVQDLRTFKRVVIAWASATAAGISASFQLVTNLLR